MSPEQIGILGIVLLFILIFLKIPVGICLLMVGVWGYFQLITPEGALSALGSELYTSVGSYSLSVIPLFVFMGMILFHAKIAEDMYIVLDYFLRRIRGGLAMATIATSAAFGAV